MTRRRLGLRRFVMRVCVIVARSFFLLAVGFMPTVVRAEYRLGTGDKLHIYVFGQKQLDHSATVDVSGKIWIPTIGRIDAANHSLEEVRERISKILTANDIIRAEDINAEVVEFRPFYIVGTVTRPGSYPYRPGLTVRQAIALAGGFARASVDQIGLLVQGDPRTSYSSIWSEYLHRHARGARLQVELEGQTRFEWNPPSRLQVPPDILKTISDHQNKELQARTKTFEHEKLNLDELIKVSKAEVVTLEQQDQRLKEEDERVTRNLSELRQLKDKGVVSLARIDSFERDVFSSRYARDSTRSQLAGARRQYAELMGKKEKQDLARREEITRDLNLVSAETDVLYSQLIAVATRMEFVGEAIDRLCAPWAKEEGVFIDRQEEGQNKRLPATEDSEVKPGDTVEVSVINEMLRAQCLSRRGADRAPARGNAAP